MHKQRGAVTKKSPCATNSSPTIKTKTRKTSVRSYTNTPTSNTPSTHLSPAQTTLHSELDSAPTHLGQKSSAFKSTTSSRKYTRLIDASLSLKNQHAKARASENIKKIREQLRQGQQNEIDSPTHNDPTHNPEFSQYLDDSTAKAQRHKSRLERKMRSKDTQHPFSAYNFNVTIIGRPNVGKSSLVNRLTGEKTSMVHNSSGVTRDWNHSAASLANLNFQVIDTAGLEEAIIANQTNPNRESDVAFGQSIPSVLRSGTSPLVTHKNKKGKTKVNVPKNEMSSNYALGRPLTKDLQESMLQLTSGAIRHSDIVVFMIDAKQGVTAQDEFFATWLRKQLHNSDQKITQNIDIANFNKYYQLLSEELKKVDTMAMYKEDPSLIPLQELQKMAHLSDFDLDSILTGTHTDRKFLRSIHTKPVIVLANKYDYGNLQNAKGLNQRVGGNGENPEEVLQQDFDLLGFDDVLPFSAIHGIGLGELYSKMVFSMGKVLKQWDVYQKKVKFIQKIHKDAVDSKEAKSLKERQDANQARKLKALEQEEALKNVVEAEVSYESDAEDEEMFRKLIEMEQNVQKKRKNGQNGQNPDENGQNDDNFESENENIFDADGNLVDLNGNPIDPFSNHPKDDQDVQGEEGQSGQNGQNGQNNGQNGRDVDETDAERVLMPTISGDSSAADKSKAHQVKFVVTGRPNAGKSTLLNALLGEKRLLTGPQPGVTRDSIKLDYSDPKFPNHHFQLVDTAGLKGITQHQHSRYDLVDSSAMQSTLKSIQNANVVALVIDVANGLYGNSGIDPVFSSQIQKNFVENVQASRFDSVYEQAKAKGASDDQLALLKRKHSAEKNAYDDKLGMLVSRVAGCVTKHELDIARVVADHGKGLLVVANKIDRLKGGQEEVQSVMKGLLALFSMTYAQNKGVTILPVSALHGTNTQQIMRKVAQLHDRWDSRIGTGILNRWLSALTKLSPPPNVGKNPLSLKYITQTNTRPPTFALFVNRKTEFPISYERFIRNSLINEFHLQGIPVRLHLRSGKNPYVSNEALTSAERFQIGKKRQRDEIMRIKQARGGKNNRQVHAGKLKTKGFAAGTNSMRYDPIQVEKNLDQQETQRKRDTGSAWHHGRDEHGI